MAMLSGIMGGLGAIWSLGSSLYAEHQIRALEVKVHTEHDHQHRSDQMIERLQKASRNSIAVQEKTVFWLRAERILDQEFRKMERNTRGWTEGVYALRSHRLHPSLVPQYVIPKLQEQARAIAQRANAHPVADLGKDFYDLPFSWVLGEDGILIIFHIPLVADPQIMIRDLFRLDSAVLQGQQKLVRFLSEEPYISVDKRRESFAVHRESDLRNCRRLKETYLCEGEGILQRKAGDCTSALFFADQALTKERCAVEVVEENQTMVRLNEHEYFAQGSDRVTLSCPNKPAQHLYPGATGLAVNVSGGCSLSGPTYDVYSVPDLGPLHTVKLNLTIGQLTAPIIVPTHWAAQALDKDIRSMESILTRQNNELDAQDTDEPPRTSPYLWPGVIGGISLILVIGGIAASGYVHQQGWPCHKTNRSTTEPISRPAQFVQDRESGHPAVTAEAPEKPPEKNEHQQLSAPALGPSAYQAHLASYFDVAGAAHHQRMRAVAEGSPA